MTTSLMLSRVQKLELVRHGKGRVISVRAGIEHTDDDVASLLASHGIVETPNDLVVVLKNLFEERDGTVARSGEPPVLLNVVPMR